MASLSLDNHAWPVDESAHLWGPWHNDQPRRGKNPPTQFRQCVHPQCNAVDRREHPSA